MTPMRLEYVFGLRISFRQTMISMRRVITLAGGMCFAVVATVFVGCSSAVELDPSLFSPAGSSFSRRSSSRWSSSSFTGNFNSSPPNSVSVKASFSIKKSTNQNQSHVS